MPIGDIVHRGTRSCGNAHARALNGWRVFASVDMGGAIHDNKATLSTGRRIHH
jgi:hypothetical protein